MKRNILFALLLLNVTYVISACATPVTYSAEPIEAWIVNADTKQPLEGVIVVAHWALEGGIHVDRVGELVILETVTDQNGRFYFPAWGPIRHWKRSRLTNMDPELLILKSGYEHKRLANPSTKEAIEGKPYPVRRLVWNGKTIGLKPFKGTVEEYAEHVYWLGSDISLMLDLARGDKECNWRKIPRMLVALNNVSRHVEDQGVRLFGRHILRIEDIPSGRGCGSPEEILWGKQP